MECQAHAHVGKGRFRRAQSPSILSGSGIVPTQADRTSGTFGTGWSGKGPIGTYARSSDQRLGAGFSMQVIQIITAEKYAELISTVEVVLERSFEGASLATLYQAVEARISELGVALRPDTAFNNDALEIGVLTEVLNTLTSRTALQRPSKGGR